MAVPARQKRKAHAASGYAKRHAKKPKLNVSDVYEYETFRTRREKLAPHLDKGERQGLGESENSDQEEDRDPAQARLVGEEGLGSDDDEVIDSDAAFEESDDERYAGFTFRGQSKNKISKSRRQERPIIDLTEGEDSVSERSNDEYFDILDVLDGRADSGAQTPPNVKQTSNLKVQSQAALELATSSKRSDDPASQDESSEDEFVEADDEVLPSDDEDLDEGALEQLNAYVSALKPENSGVDQGTAASPEEARRSHKKRCEITQTGEENEFAAAPQTGQLRIDDLLAPLGGPSTSLESLKQSVKPLTPSSTKKREGGVLSAPLATRTQDRLDREAAYEQTKEEVDKWKATMKRIREAEHLSFPLQPPTVSQTSNLELTAKFTPQTELESAVDNLLKSAKMREKDISATEDLQMNDLSIEEIKRRRAELRSMRDLMFRAELKAKRVSKIKSKAYRRIQRKQQEKLSSILKDGEEEGSDEDQMRLEIARAQERATLKHSTVSKFGRSKAGRAEVDIDQRREINDMLDRGEALRRKIQGTDGSDISGDSDGSADEDEESLRAKAFDTIQALQQEEKPSVDRSKSGLFSMKFMQDAADRQSRQLQADAEDILGALDSSADVTADNARSKALVEKIGGRMVFHPGKESTRPQSAPSRQTVSAPAPMNVSQEMPSESFSQKLGEEPNPWLVDADDSAPLKTSRKRKEVLISKNSKPEDRSKHAFAKKTGKMASHRSLQPDDSVVEISMDVTLSLPTSSLSVQSKVKRSGATLSAAQEKSDSSDSDSDSERDEQEALASQKTVPGKIAISTEQRKLVARAFAGDNVVEQFNATKEREMEADAPKQKDTTLAGWGAWGGKGTKKKPPKPHLIKQVAGIEPSSRADFGKAHVIISEKKDKKAAKYRVKDLPYPYTSKAQFERSMDSAVGTEWNTRVGFQRATLPRVVTKMGTVIDPLTKLF